MLNSPQLDLYDFHCGNSGYIIFSYKGTFNLKILSILGNYIKEALTKQKLASKKLFKIFIELAQNISYYSDEAELNEDGKRIGIGSMILLEQADCYLLFSGNIVQKSNLNAVIEKCTIINSLDQDGLRDFKRQQLLLPDSKFNGANIGMIKVVLTSVNPFEVIIKDVDANNSFFGMIVKVEKTNESI